MDETGRQEIIEAAANAVLNDRNRYYGPPKDDFECVTDMFNAYMAHKRSEGPRMVEAQDHAVYMILVKVARIAQSPLHKDNWVDIAGYAACGWEAAQ